LFYESKQDENGEYSFSMFPHANISIEFDELLTCEIEPIENLRQWVHYFGIKDRIARNYYLLKKSCKEIKAKVNFPEWS